VNFEDAKEVSVGTVMEIAWADAWDKYILIVMDSTNPHYHGMINEVASLIVPTLDEALELIPMILAQTS
jgi:hypothetical protein